MATEVYCKCNQWQEWSESIFMAQVARTLQTGIKYTGEQWAFCPWCGRHLTKRAPDAGDSAASTGSLPAQADPASEGITPPTQRR